MDSYNSPSEYANDYGPANSDYNDHIDIDRRQSESMATESRLGPRPFPTTPTDDRKIYSATKYSMVNGNSGYSHEKRGDVINTHNNHMSGMHKSPTKKNNTGLTRYV